MIETFWEVEKLNSQGNTFKRAGAGRSFVKHMVSMLYSRVSRNSNTQVDINGTSSTVINGDYDLRAIMASGDEQAIPSNASVLNKTEQVGILVGTGTAAVSYDNYHMAAICAHGIGTGNLLYWGGLIEPVVVSAPYAYFDMSRILENKSGGSIVVAELGIATLGMVSSAPYTFLVCRDVLDVPDRVTLADTETLKVTYRIRVSV